MTPLLSEARWYKPSWIASDVERLALIEECDDDLPRRASKPVPELPDWDAIHFTIQDLLKALVHRVRLCCPEVHTISGRTSGPAFPLYSYVSFDLGPTDVIDAVVAGIDFRAETDGGFRIEGSICGEESGRVDYEEIARVPHGTTEAALAEASRLARELISRHDVIVDVLRRRPPIPTY